MLVSAAALTLDRLLYTEQLRSLAVELALLPAAGRAEVLIAHGVRVEAAPGDPATLELDGGEGAATVLTGTVAAVERSPEGTRLAIADAGAALAAVRPHETYAGLTAMQIVSQLADLARVETGLVVAPLQSAAYVAEPRRTAAEHIAALAHRAGAAAAVDADGALTLTPWPLGLPTVAMRRDREFVSLAVSSRAQAPAVTPVGAGGAANALAPDAWVHDAAPVTDAAAPDGRTAWRADPVLRASLDVAQAQRAGDTRRAALARTMEGHCWLQPARRPGEVVQIQQTEHGEEAGPWLLTAVHHAVGWDGAATVLRGVAVGPGGGAGGLAGAALAGAAGALG